MTFGRYLAYRLKSSALRSTVSAVLSLGIVLYAVADLNKYAGEYVNLNRTGLYMLAIVLGIFATVIPMIETACFKNRRDLDALYSFPIKRYKLALAHYLSGLIQVIFIYSVNFFAAFAWLAANTTWFDLRPMMLYYLISLLLGWILYSFFIFIFGQANTVVDGVVISVLWMFAAGLLSSAIADTFDINNLNSDLGIAYAPLNGVTELFQRFIEINRRNYSRPNLESKENYALLAWLIGWGVAAIGSAVGYFLTLLRRGAQKAGEISDSWFSYKLLIPLYGICLLIISGGSGSMKLIIFTAMAVGYIIYRRSFKLKWNDCIFLGAALLMMLNLW